MKLPDDGLQIDMLMQHGSVAGVFRVARLADAMHPPPHMVCGWRGCITSHRRLIALSTVCRFNQSELHTIERAG